MLKKKITYTDYNDEERSEDFYFNLSKAEMMEMEMTTPGGYEAYIKKIVDAKDLKTLVAIFQELILKAYGEKSPDGKRFMKNDELRTAFKETEAYSNLFIELSTNTDAAVAFVNGILPKIDK